MIQTHSRKVFRANLDDVENLSYGWGAKKQRGTGSRFTCHRLNRDERRIFDQAKRDGFLTVRGTGYRKNRKGSPVANTFRQRCDALAEICVTVEKRSDSDRVVIDFSTLRVQDDSALVLFLIETVFRTDHPGFYEALISKSHNANNFQQVGAETDSDKNDANEYSSIQVENTTPRPIHWDTVKSEPIWGVDERLLVVTLDREAAKSVATNVLKAIKSPQFVGLQSDAETITEIISAESRATIEEQRTMGRAKPNTGKKIGGVPMASDNHGNNIDCIDWDDI